MLLLGHILNPLPSTKLYSCANSYLLHFEYFRFALFFLEMLIKCKKSGSKDWDLDENMRTSNSGSHLDPRNLYMAILFHLESSGFIVHLALKFV